MTRPVVETNNRLAVRLSAEDKATIARAAVIEQVDLTAFVVRNALHVAREVIDREERLMLPRRDSRCVIDLLEHPPAPAPRCFAPLVILRLKNDAIALRRGSHRQGS